MKREVALVILIEQGKRTLTEGHVLPLIMMAR